MSRLRVGKKLEPAKKTWKSISKKVQSKVHKLNIPKSIEATFKHLLAILHSLHHLIPSRGRRRPSLPSNNYHVHHCKKNMSAIRIDNLFTEPSSVHAHDQGKTSRGKEVIIDSSMDTIEDAWKALDAKTPELHVDQKVEEFIAKFREEMRLQKERSLQEFLEMLARGCRHYYLSPLFCVLHFDLLFLFFINFRFC
ncbi:hypothetical protein JHK87_057134 [Glycine soja]|nr:hypothetical protein JHK87_057134 [Glycine soja]